MTTPQTGQLRPSTPDRYEEISRHLLQQAGEELDKGDALQASEKIWGATAHALKAIAQQRGWNHRFHNHLRAAAFYLAAAWDRPDWITTFSSLEGSHTNYYEHQRYPGDVRPFLELARVYCQELGNARHSVQPQGVQPTIEQQATQAIHLRTLTRQLGEHTAFGDELTPEELQDLPPVSPTQS